MKNESEYDVRSENGGYTVIALVVVIAVLFGVLSSTALAVAGRNAIVRERGFARETLILRASGDIEAFRGLAEQKRSREELDALYRLFGGGDIGELTGDISEAEGRLARFILVSFHDDGSLTVTSSRTNGTDTAVVTAVLEVTILTEEAAWENETITVETKYRSLRYEVR